MDNRNRVNRRKTPVPTQGYMEALERYKKANWYKFLDELDWEEIFTKAGLSALVIFILWVLALLGCGALAIVGYAMKETSQKIMEAGLFYFIIPVFALAILTGASAAIYHIVKRIINGY